MEQIKKKKDQIEKTDFNSEKKIAKVQIDKK